MTPEDFSNLGLGDFDEIKTNIIRQAPHRVVFYAALKKLFIDSETSQRTAFTADLLNQGFSLEDDIVNVFDEFLGQVCDLLPKWDSVNSNSEADIVAHLVASDAVLKELTTKIAIFRIYISEHCDIVTLVG